MKIIHFIIGLILCCFLEITAQTVSYGYDAAGNRISRVITLPGLRASSDTVQEEPKVYSEMLQDLEIRIYPNPTDGILSIEVSKLPEGESARFSLYSLSGNLLVDRKSSSGYETLDLTGQPSGTYILRIVAGENRTEWKVVKK